MPIVDKLAGLLAKARTSTTRLPMSEVEQAAKSMSVEDGYAVMRKTAQLLEPQNGWKVAGYKVGATSKGVQGRLGLSGPFWGVIYESAKMQAAPRGGNIARFSVKEDLIRGIEAEFAFHISKDIVPRSNPYSAEELLKEYCSTVIPCVEVCGFRLPSELGGVASLVVADTGNTAVLFPPEVFARQASDVVKDLPGSKTTVAIDGVDVASGSGAEVLGSPALALEWFVKEVCNGPTQLTIPQGSFVTTGATCGLIPITKSGYVHVAFNGVSKCDIHIAFRE